ncbi:SusD/RagB family nutrient-binding outer membrane lipoprotein [Mucilaginibacter auburnensis]|uniref:SusD-like starch-binding protein associating with outer membrane n=1 Tax=Mucilaginibacter auburnensis TaxID=1457233 RepID=A0A2H9VLY3_9SPHI|nr:SusD/RagB family nutrient-binding outer membrane lipoprotein [Mucilaginibacter auburnensis]PJJ79357.1 SusD-like starch-binding protein associating with outer membrane [Mucilaginibacter auburnensis]
MKKAYILLVMLIAITSSCTKDFEKINTDPNRPTSVNPGVVLGQMQYRMVSSSISAARGFTHELMQVDAPRSSTSNGVHRYVINPGTGVWNSFYTLLADVNVVISSAERLKENNYKAIGLIYKCWAYSILTDVYGDVPYSEAMNAAGGNVQPKFDSQKDIYTQILKDLDEANNLFDDNKVLTYGGDNVYPSNALTSGKNVGIQRWKKFGNTLKLRLLLRLEKRAAEMNTAAQISAILADPAKYPVFSSNAEEGIYKFPNVYPYFNPYYTARQLDWRDGTYFTKFFLGNLNNWNDPRRAVWAIPVSGVYQGIDSGYPTTVEYVVGKNSSYVDALKTSSITGVMLTYAEEEFIKAELALKGFNTGKTAKAHYEAGITAAMAQWGVTVPTGYLQQAGVNFDEDPSMAAQLEKIITQKYYAYFFVDYQAWLEKRRTGYPVLPRGTGIPTENQFPNRIPYPTYLQSLNPVNLKAAVTAMGGDNSNVKVWWDK